MYQPERRKEFAVVPEYLNLRYVCFFEVVNGVIFDPPYFDELAASRGCDQKSVVGGL